MTCAICSLPMDNDYYKFEGVFEHCMICVSCIDYIRGLLKCDNCDTRDVGTNMWHIRGVVICEKCMKSYHVKA